MKRKSPIFRKRKQRKSALRLRESKRVSKWIRAAHRRTVTSPHCNDRPCDVLGISLHVYAVAFQTYR
jgi:hypothetical protein